MKQRVELHGLSTCPFAWRTRLAAAEKGVNVEWVPWDAPDAGRRSMTHNPDRHSPVMIHDWLTLTDAVVISLYLDEAFPGRPLQPEDPAKRALMRVALAALERTIVFDGQAVVTSELRERIALGWNALDARLGEGRWLGGEAPSILDVLVLPFAATMATRLGQPPTDRVPRARDYWAMAQRLPGYLATRPAWAKKTEAEVRYMALH